MLNNVTIMGRLTADPELKHTPSNTAVCSFTIAVERDIKDKQTGDKITDFIDCVAWRSTAEITSRYFSKGRMIVITGRLQTRAWEDKQRNKRKVVEVVADNVYFGDSKKGTESQTPSEYEDLPPFELADEDENYNLPF